MYRRKFFRHGGLGVPFFFVLSGFIMAYVYDNNAFSIKDFLIARVFRILPLYWFVLFLAIAFELCKYFASTYFHMSFGTQAFSGHNEVKEILPNLLLLQSWLPHTDSSSFNFPSWSLSVEWYLYIIFGSFMFLPKSLRYISFTILSLLSFIHYLDFLRPEAQKGVLFFFLWMCYLSGFHKTTKL
ncbi:acyltransferase family protein [Helicobacter sp.]|uniref:acyltransferase family protein n=1 Tax=Helicobacter sp. TaxID=218 RepID=UPI003750C65D